MSVSPIAFPRLRPIDIRPVQQRGQVAFLLRDPLQLSDQALVVPRYLGPVLLLCDGQRDLAAICAALAEEYGLLLTAPLIEGLLHALDGALLLDNERFAQVRADAVAAFRAQPFRPMSHVGAVYPAQSGALAAMLDGYLAEADAGAAQQTATRAVFSPHIDYARGGPVYGATWGRARELVEGAETVILLATDHAGGDLITLTTQSYATPYGVLPTDQEAVAALAEAVGVERAFAGELHHRGEHAIELVAVWLHHLRGGRPCRLVPVLCGSFAPFVRGEADLATDPTVARLLAALRDLVAARNAVVVTSGDLSHVGPAFGGAPHDQDGWDAIKGFDDGLIDRLCAGDADGFFRLIEQAGDRTNVCGVPPFYLALKLLGAPAGTLAAYDCCPADEGRTSLVSVCGVVY